jgi:hypothetical protein
MKLGLVCLFFLLLVARIGAAEAITLDGVLTSVTAKYPPYLMALIERDIAAGRLRQAQGAFDLGFVSKGSFNPSGFYDGGAADFVFDQPLPFWGGNVFLGPIAVLVGKGGRSLGQTNRRVIHHALQRQTPQVGQPISRHPPRFAQADPIL